jgi:hypothetical protein
MIKKAKREIIKRGKEERPLGNLGEDNRESLMTRD